MLSIEECLRKAVKTEDGRDKDGSEKASDIFIGAMRYITFKIGGIIRRQEEIGRLTVDEAEKLVTSIYEKAKRPMDKFLETGDDDFTLSLPDIARFRVSAYRQRGTMAAIIRVVEFKIPDFKFMNIPDEVMKIAQVRRGLVLVTGPAGSGKTTTLACLIDAINKSRNSHIITLEDPIEFLHRDDKSLISQREVSIDTGSYITALRACLRQAPDIIFLGEMRDYETIRTAMTAAETGHLVISTLHTVGAVNTIDRIIDVFPSEQQHQLRVQMSMLLQTVVSQQLLPNKAGSLSPAFEIMHMNSAIRNLVRDSKIQMISGVIETSGQDGMVTMDMSIQKLFQKGEITAEVAVSYAVNIDNMMRKLNISAN